MVIARNATLATALLTLCSFAAHAGFFDDPTNLKVLPEDISAAELGQTMKMFAQGTGSRCSSCHVGEVEADLNTYDFALDDMKKKDKAREMIVLVRDINAQIAAAFPDVHESPVQVTCATCHRGQAKPIMIEELLAQTVDADGIDAAVSKYRDLRERYYGGYTFDFSEPVLMRLAEDYGAADEFDAALRFVNLNLEFFPQSFRSYAVRAQVLAERGDIAGARRDFAKAIELEPGSAWLKQQLADLD